MPVRYGLDIDFEKFMVAHGDAANPCKHEAGSIRTT
jgi:hypothetical protein